MVPDLQIDWSDISSNFSRYLSAPRRFRRTRSTPQSCAVPRVPCTTDGTQRWPQRASACIHVRSLRARAEHTARTDNVSVGNHARAGSCHFGAGVGAAVACEKTICQLVVFRTQTWVVTKSTTRALPSLFRTDTWRKAVETAELP